MDQAGDLPSHSLCNRVVVVVGRTENFTGGGVQKIPGMERVIGSIIASDRRGEAGRLTPYIGSNNDSR